jgi:hypothetical protein
MTVNTVSLIARIHYQAYRQHPNVCLPTDPLALCYHNATVLGFPDITDDMESLLCDVYSVSQNFNTLIRQYLYIPGVV